MEETKVPTIEKRCPDFYKEKMKVSKKKSLIRELYNTFIHRFKK